MKLRYFLLTVSLVSIFVACDKKKGDANKAKTDSTKTTTDTSTSSATTTISETAAAAESTAAANVPAGKEKIAYIDGQGLLSLIPEYIAAGKKAEELYKAKAAEIQSLEAEMQKKYANYQQFAEKLSEAERKSREDELNAMGQRLQEMQYKGENELQKEQARLGKPIIDRANKAIREVAKENGYTFVIDVSMQGTLLYADSTRDIMGLVKQKLGLKGKK
jgi:outer membrane protein